MHTDALVAGGANNVGSCYNSQYTYYHSFVCDTAVRNCLDRLDYCTGLDDPFVKAAREEREERLRLVAICVPSILGGLCLLGICCTAAAAYYGVNFYRTRQE